MTAMRLHRYPSPSGGIALGKMGVGAKMMKCLPYDAEVEYLESTGTQWIDTGVSIRDIYSYRTTEILTAASTNAAEGYTAASNYLFFGVKSNNIFYGGMYSTIMDIAENDNAPHTIEIKPTSRHFLLDGTIVRTFPASSFARKGNFYLYACNGDGGIDGDAGYFLTAQKSQTKIYGRDNILLRDYIPVRVGTTGELYDRVSGTFAERHGDFVIGPDINAPAI